MKKYYILYLLLLSLNISFGQANVTSSGISVQGIARANDEVTVLPNQSLSISINLYYLDGSTETSLITRTGNITTDGFGIFTYVVDINNTDFARISNYATWIKVSSGSTVFVNEKLKIAPYAIHAQNGVPTGSILPFAGGSVPPGWLLADGRAIPNDDYHAALRAIFGNSLPDLRGIFLRGTGTSPSGSQYTGPALRAIQTDGLQGHPHGFSWSGTANSAGTHTHAVPFDVGGSVRIPYSFDGGTIEASGGGAANSDDMWIGQYFTLSGSHTHTYNVTSATGSFGIAAETRAANYGVYYIVKI